MNEFMGLIHGMYEAKKDGFLPGRVQVLVQPGALQSQCYASMHMCAGAHAHALSGLWYFAHGATYAATRVFFPKMLSVQ